MPLDAASLKKAIPSSLNASSIKRSLGILGIGGEIPPSVLGEEGIEVPLYDKFVSDVLQDPRNALTESSYWILFFDLPTYKFGNLALDMENMDLTPWDVGENIALAQDQFATNAKKTVMMVQGVKIPGDKFNVERQSDANMGGFLGAPMGGGREELPELEVTFRENNISVSDMVIRPWIIDSSYSSMKFAIKATITCYNLTRSEFGFRVRKGYKFHNAVPTSLESEAYVYSAGSEPEHRQTTFVYSHYSMFDGDTVLGDFKQNFLQLGNFAFLESLGPLGAKANDLIVGGANRVLSNIEGNFLDSVNAHIGDLQSKVRGVFSGFEDDIIDSGKQVAKSILGTPGDENDDTSSGGGVQSVSVNNTTAGIILTPVTADDNDNTTEERGALASLERISSTKLVGVPTGSDDTVDVAGLKSVEVGISSNEGSYTPSEVEIGANSGEFSPSAVTVGGNDITDGEGLGSSVTVNADDNV